MKYWIKISILLLIILAVITIIIFINPKINNKISFPGFNIATKNEAEQEPLNDRFLVSIEEQFKNNEEPKLYLTLRTEELQGVGGCIKLAASNSIDNDSIFIEIDGISSIEGVACTFGMEYLFYKIQLPYHTEQNYNVYVKNGSKTEEFELGVMQDKIILKPSKNKLLFFEQKKLLRIPPNSIWIKMYHRDWLNTRVIQDKFINELIRLGAKQIFPAGDTYTVNHLWNQEPKQYENRPNLHMEYLFFETEASEETLQTIIDDIIKKENISINIWTYKGFSLYSYPKN